MACHQIESTPSSEMPHIVDMRNQMISEFTIDEQCHAELVEMTDHQHISESMINEIGEKHNKKNEMEEIRHGHYQPLFGIPMALALQKLGSWTRW